MYKIGEAARLLGLSTEALRHYERKGLIVPYKDESSNYRYFDAIQINQLLHIQKYKKLGFSLHELANLSKDNESQSFYDMLIDKEQEMVEESRMLNLRIESMRMAMEGNQLAMKAQKSVQWGIRPSMYRIPYMHNKQLLEEKQRTDELKNWSKCSELQFLSTRIIWTDLEQETYSLDQGLCMHSKIAELMGVQANDTIKFYDACPALLHSFEETGENSIRLEIEFIKEFMERNRVCATGDILSEILYSHEEKKSYRVRHLLWIPYKITN